jgi:hypothetical protein
VRRDLTEGVDSPAHEKLPLPPHVARKRSVSVPWCRGEPF